MKKIDLFEKMAVLQKSPPGSISLEPKTLDELDKIYVIVETLLDNDENVLYYNVYSFLSTMNKTFLSHYEKSETDINALIEKEGYTECNDPYVRFIRKVTKNGNRFSNYYSERLFEIIGDENIKKVCADDTEVMSRFITLLDLYSVQAEGEQNTVYKIAGKDIPCRWAYQRFLEFDTRSWERIYDFYLEHWSPAVINEKNFKRIPEYSPAEKMLAYYYLDFCYER